MILDQSAKIDWIYDIFFNTGIGLHTLVSEEHINTQSVLRTISSEISVNKEVIKIDRTEIINAIIREAQPHKHYILHGTGGCGKTALLKDLVTTVNDSFPVCIRRAQSLNALDSSVFFKHTHPFSENQFKDAYALDNPKIFIIDSAERIQEIEYKETLVSFMGGSII